MTNAGNYTDTTDTDFKGAGYNIDTGKSLSAEGVRNALHTKEKVANKQVDSTDADGTLSSSSSDSYYPTSKLVGKNLDVLRAALMDVVLPIGTIIAMHNKTYYNTANEAFRAKWKVCDGAPGSGTPDLRNLFLRGMADGGTAAVGSDSVTLAASNLPSHSHTFTGNNATGVINIISGSFTAGGVFSRYPATQNNHITAPIQGTDDSIAFSMTPSGSVTGGGGNPQTAISIVPKYYAVIYVMKIA